MDSIMLKDIDGSDRKEIAISISTLFKGRVPTTEREFITVLTDAEADKIMAPLSSKYTLFDLDLTYSAHDMFIMYGEVMR